MSKKTKNVPGSQIPWFKISAYLIGFTLFLFAFIFFLQTRDTYRIRKMDEVQRQYADAHDRADQWFMNQVPKPDFIPKATDDVWKRGEEIRKNLASCSHVSEETKKIWDLFQDFGTTLQLNPGTFPDKFLLHTVGSPDHKDMIGLAKHHEVSFLPKDLAEFHIKYGRTSVLLTWRNDIGISLAAIEWPEKFLAGALYHEFYHGSLHPVDYANPNKGYYSPETPEYALEEIRAHTIESSVLNFKSNGLYHKKFDEIIERGIFRRNTEDILVFVTIEDLKEFDKMFGLESSGGFVASFAYSQYIYALAIYHMDKQGKAEGDKVELYRKLARLGVMN